MKGRRVWVGVTAVNGAIAIAQKALKTAMSKVKALTPRGTDKTLEAALKSIKQWYVGWSNYYSLSNYPRGGCYLSVAKRELKPTRRWTSKNLWFLVRYGGAENAGG